MLEQNKTSFKIYFRKRIALKHQFSNNNLTFFNLHLNVGHPIWYVHGSKAPRGDVRKRYPCEKDPHLTSMILNGSQQGISYWITLHQEHMNKNLQHLLPRAASRLQPVVMRVPHADTLQRASHKHRVTWTRAKRQLKEILVIDSTINGVGEVWAAQDCLPEHGFFNLVSLGYFWRSYRRLS